MDEKDTNVRKKRHSRKICHYSHSAAGEYLYRTRGVSVKLHLIDGRTEGRTDRRRESNLVHLVAII